MHFVTRLQPSNGGKLASIDVTIRIDKAHAARMDEIVSSLKAKGLGASRRTCGSWS